MVIRGVVWRCVWSKVTQVVSVVSLLLLLSRGTVDGRNPAPVENSWYAVYLIINKVLYIPHGAGLLPSTVFLHMNIVPWNLGEVGNHCHRLLDVAVREPVRMCFFFFFRSLWHSESRHREISWKHLWFVFLKLRWRFGLKFHWHFRIWTGMLLDPCAWSLRISEKWLEVPGSDFWGFLVSPPNMKFE